MRPLSEVHGAWDAEARLRRACVGSSAAAIEVRHQIQQRPHATRRSCSPEKPASAKRWPRRGLHALSAQAASPFMTIHRAGITDTLLQSELFGHRRAASPTPIATAAEKGSGWRDAVVGCKPEQALGSPSPPTFDERRPTVGDRLFDDLLRDGHSFWTTVYTPFMEREITRDDVRSVIRRGLVTAGGNYRIVARLFKIAPQEYKKFLGFLRRNDCRLPYGDYR